MMPGLLQETLNYAVGHTDELQRALLQHLQLVAVALGAALALCLPLGLWTSRSGPAGRVILNAANGLRVIPSLAVLFLAIPWFGLTFATAALALTLLALPPILVNTDAAFRTLEGSVSEAAAAMGMTPAQRLWRVETPLALPVIVAGIRIAALEVIASATLAAFIGSGGLGLFIVRGFALYDFSILLVGAVPVALLALLVDLLLGRLHHRLQPPGLA